MSQYNRLVKCLLGVRKNTSIDLCLIESGIEPINYLLSKKRKRSLESKLASPDWEGPFHLVLELCRSANTPGYRYIQKALQFNCDVNPLEKLLQSVRSKPESATKFHTYRTILNPCLSVHIVYTNDRHQYVPDYTRQAFSRLRLMSHDLKIETGRWSRIPREMRKCPCDGQSVQTESHVLVGCTLTAHLRTKYGLVDIRSVDALFHEYRDISMICKYVYEVLKVMKN